LKTGTPPRLDRRSIDFARAVNDGRFALEPVTIRRCRFSFLTESIEIRQTPCYLTHTNARVREIVTANIDKSPLFNGQIRGIGPTVLPVARGQDRAVPAAGAASDLSRAEGLDVDEIYVNGLSMSLPADVQLEIVRAMPVSRTRACCGRHTRLSTTSFSRPSCPVRWRQRRSPDFFLRARSTARRVTRKPRRRALLRGRMRRCVSRDGARSRLAEAIRTLELW
jgi:hypothetical protein